MNAIIGFLLAFVAGFVDTATFVGAGGVFSAHITGNFVLFAVAVFKGFKDVDFLKIFLFVPFLLSIAFVGRMSRKAVLEKKFEPVMLFLASLLLLAPGLYFFGAAKPDENFWGPTTFFVTLTVLAMGIQNGLGKVVSPTEPMTTVMTGNVIQIALEIIGYNSKKGDHIYHREKAVSLFKVIVGFALGCLCSAWMVVNHSMGALIVPAVILAVLGVYKWNMNSGTEVPNE